MVGLNAWLDQGHQVVMVAATEHRCRQDVLGRQRLKRAEAINVQCGIVGVGLRESIAQLTSSLFRWQKKITKKLFIVAVGKCRWCERVARCFL